MKLRFFPLHILVGIFLASLAGCSDDEKRQSDMSPGMTMEPVGVSSRPMMSAPEDIRIHFKKPSNWGEPRIYAYGEQGAVTEEYAGEWPGTKMEPEANGWYVFSIRNVERANVVFSDGNRQLPRAQWPSYDFIRESGEWWWSDGSWHDTNPDMPAPMN